MTLEKAKEFLAAAEVCFSKDYLNATATCSYYAFFWAAAVALGREGFHQEAWSHGGLRDTFFTELVKKRNLYPRNFREFFSRAYDERLTACYKTQNIGKKVTQRTLTHGKEFIRKAEEVTQR